MAVKQQLPFTRLPVPSPVPPSVIHDVYDKLAAVYVPTQRTTDQIIVINERLDALEGKGSSGGPTTVQIQFGTHLQRLASDPSSFGVGSQFCELDRTRVTYIISPDNPTAWSYYVGAYYDNVSNRPTDLGINDFGFQFRGLDLVMNMFWNGSIWRT